jgi:WD40 repeat protein
MTDPDPSTRTEGEGETLDMPEGMKGFTPGQVLGERYQVRSLLGRGGMGEVWHAFDLKLRVEVALKALREDLFRSGRRLEMLRDEVRAAREVVSPNVCRIFDLIEIEGRELVSMEYVDGATLLDVLFERGPLELKEAQDIASQFLAGLEAIHKAGLIHRDIKPENIMLTRAGRVVVMDFGLARQEAEGGGTVSGTPAYMAPEQAAGQTLDARADVYAAGVVLAEMVSPDGIKNIQSRQSVWEGVRTEPAKVPDTPWAEVIKKAVKKDREQRFNSAHTLTRALEDVTLRVEGAEDLHPYPGLASFTEEDSEYFFGREAEVEQMWRKLEGPPRMLGLVGPSGAGKTSFLNAGLIPAARADWAAVACTPGSDPRAALRRAVISQLEGDAEALRELAEGSDTASVSAVARWRRRHGHAVVIVDQFEELFTQNTPDEQHRFTALLERLVLEADAFVLLSMRDDFLIHCNRHEALRPLFSELTPLDPPSGGSLRRALTQPALQCGYRFEDDEMVDEMLAEVEGERGALPLLAFAAARLWEKRDRQTGLLTRQTYHDIGGVGGALARHAEATIDQIGHERLPIVRELFRNLVTAEGTRAVREWDELLSVFCDSSDESQAAVLRALIDARLLTSYEVREDDREPIRRVEIIHESLLANWPRLVRWQTQDADAAQLRDQLRQAAKTWDEHRRSDDTLWTGATCREFASWRERYPGGLSDLEEEFASAMSAFAMRRRLRRRFAVSATIILLLVGLVVVGTFWRRSVLETRRAEASKLLALADAELSSERPESNPSAALAFVVKSLELSDTSDGRLVALRALWDGPMALVPEDALWDDSVFSPDGRWLARRSGVDLVLTPPKPEGQVRLAEAPGFMMWLQLSSMSSHLMAVAMPDAWSTRDPRSVKVWTVPYGQEVQSWDFAADVDTGPSFSKTRVRLRDQQSVAVTFSAGEVRIETRPLGSGLSGAERRIRAPLLEGGAMIAVDRSATLAAYTAGCDLHVLELDGSVSDRVVARTPAEPVWITLHAMNNLVAAAQSDGTVRVWSTESIEDQPLRIFHGRRGFRQVTFDQTGTRLLMPTNVGTVQIWQLDGPSGADPLEVHVKDASEIYFAEVDPSERWLVASTFRYGPVLWPLGNQYPFVLRGHTDKVWSVSFTPDGRYLASCGQDGTVRLWPLDPSDGHPEILLEGKGRLGCVAASPDGTFLAVAGDVDIWVVPLDETPPRSLHTFDQYRLPVAISPDSKFVATSGSGVAHVWHVDSGEHWVLSDPKVQAGAEHFLQFTPDGQRLVGGGGGGVVVWDLKDGTTRHLGPGWSGDVSSDGRYFYTGVGVVHGGLSHQVVVYDLATSQSSVIRTDEGMVASVALDQEETRIISTGRAGEFRVGPIGGEEPHLMFGNKGWVLRSCVSPDNRWIATPSADGAVRLWPMPDLAKPPLHTLPHYELIAKLKALTNLRAVRDAESSTGWKIEIGPFPGWAEVPEW